MRAAALLIGLTAELHEPGKVAFTLCIRQTGHKQFIATINLSLYQLLYSNGVQNRNKTPGITTLVTQRSR